MVKGQIVVKQFKDKNLFGKLDGNIVWMALFLAVIHFICNVQIKTISFATDEIIPLMIAADRAGLDWTHCREMNYYYGYVSLLCYIPIMKLPFIYNNSFLLTQVLFGINSVFHIVATILLYKSLLLIAGNEAKKHNVCLISLICSCVIQFFNVAQGIQIEALFCLFAMITFYCITRISYGHDTVLDYACIGISSCLAYINNGRGIVIIIAGVMVLTYILVLRKGRKWYQFLVYITSMGGLFLFHKLYVKPHYMTYFSINANNTDAGGYVDKIISVLTDLVNFKAFVKMCISWIWSADVSTYGLFILSIILITVACFACLKDREHEKNAVNIFVLLLFWGTLVMATINMIVSARAYFAGVSDMLRADKVFYVRYLTCTLPLVIGMGLVYFQEEMAKKRMIWLAFVISICLFFVFSIYVAPRIDGASYGTNNSSFISLMIQGWDNNSRYGIVASNRFILCEIVSVVGLIIYLIGKYSRQYTRVFGFVFGLSIIFCSMYAGSLTSERGDFYKNCFNQELIEYCKNSDAKTVYVSYNAATAQYEMPDKVVYFDQINTQDLMLVKDDCIAQVDWELYRILEKRDAWYLLYRIDSQLY